MKKIVIDGKTYQKATDVAKDLGYTSDYVGQLCRAGKVEAQQVGRTWFVVPETIHEHKKSRYRSNQAKSKAAIAAYHSAAQTTSQTIADAITPSRLSSHHYETDETDLIPRLRSQTPKKSEPEEPSPSSSPSIQNTDRIQSVATKIPIHIKRSERISHHSKKPLTGLINSKKVDRARDTGAVSHIPTDTKLKLATTNGLSRKHTAAYRQNNIIVTSSEDEARTITITSLRTPKVTSLLAVKIALSTFITLLLVVTLMSMKIDYVYQDGRVTQKISLHPHFVTDFINKNIVILFKQ
jgi:hypothetical protein